MTKRILILAILLPFFITSTGLPLTIHFCNTIINGGVTNCKICDHNSIINFNHNSCNCICTQNNNVKIKSQDCCGFKVILVRIKDSFLSSGKNLKKHIKILSPQVFPSLMMVLQKTTFSDTYAKGGRGVGKYPP